MSPEEIEQLQSDLKVAEIGAAFGKVAVSERDLARYQLEKARAEIERLREVIRSAYYSDMATMNDELEAELHR